MASPQNPPTRPLVDAYPETSVTTLSTESLIQSRRSAARRGCFLPSAARAPYGARASTLRRMLRSFSNTVGVSNFRPTAARAIIHRYSRPGGRILDFSAGYGGRSLGALTLGRNYVGIDPSGPQVRGLQNMIQVCGPKACYRGHAEILHGPAEGILPEIRGGSFDLVFSSPPHFDRERYGSEPDQSFIRFPTLQQWLDGFLRVALVESARVLRKRGWLVLNVGNSPECFSSFVQLCTRPALRLLKKMHLQLAKLPYKRLHSMDAFKTTSTGFREAVGP